MFSIRSLRILCMHTLYFDHVPSQPHCLTLPDPPLSCHPLQTLHSFLFPNPFSSVYTTYIIIGVRTAAGATAL